MFDTKDYEAKMNGAMEHFEAELRRVRTGRAHAGMLEGIMVEAYGSKMPLNQVANVTAPEAQMLLVSPFDPSQITAITTAIRDSQSLGLNPSDDGRVVRVPIPALTEDRRRDMVKQASEKAESCKIALRGIRQDGFKELKKLKDDKHVSEDEQKSIEKDIDILMRDFGLKIDQIFKAKEQEILKV